MLSRTPSLPDLADRTRFEPVETVDHAHIAAWVRPHLYQWRWIPVTYWALNAAIAVMVVETWSRAQLPVLDGVSTACLGMVVGFAGLLPIHEQVHAWMYRRQGARDVTVTYQWRRFTALCLAPGEVLDGRRFLKVCLAPLVVISAGLVLVWVWLPAGRLELAAAGALLLHTGAASGDVAFAAFTWAHGPDRVWTWDDPDAPVTHFVRAVGS